MRFGFALAVLTLVAGCSFRPGLATSDGAIADAAAGSDAPGGVDSDASGITADAPTPDGDAGLCLGSGNFRVCIPQVPQSSDDLNGVTIDTGDMDDCSYLVPQNNRTLCVRAGTTITVGGTVAVEGDNPLVLLATQDITITGTLDVASHRGGKRGPGANPQICSTPGDGTSATGGAGGGAGGSFGTNGGDGGKGSNGAIAGGTHGGTSPADHLRGGCRGGAGGAGGGDARTGGPGGGAVYLLAGGTITVSGTINASGAGGGAGNHPKGGGGGGGSGGMIAFDAQMIDVTVAGEVFANGGGGGGGADNGNDGKPGDESTAATTAGGGGAGGGPAGGPGGTGATSLVPAGSPAQAGNGGGGGGGGLGVIRVLSNQPLTTLGGTFSPAPVH